MTPRLAVAVAAGVAAAVAGCSGSSPGTGAGPSPGNSGSSASTPTPTTTTSPSPSASAHSATLPAGAVPAGFQVIDATFVSTTTGWLLGTAPCSHKPCTSIVRTSDGGRHWVGAPAPVAYLVGSDLTTDRNADCTKVPCISGLRFASRSVGYAYGTNALFMTTDGGRRWRRLAGPGTGSGPQPRPAVGADALEASGGQVLRVREVRSGCPGCAFAIERSTSGSTRWTATSAPRVTGDAATLTWSGDYAGELIHANPAGGASSAHSTLVTSGDAGATWRQLPDPCGGTGRSENDAQEMAASSDGTFGVVCRPRTSGGAGFVLLSTDVGRTWRRAAALPAKGLAGLALAVPDAHDVYVTGPTDSARTVVLASHDGGRSWRQVLSRHTPDGIDHDFLGFESRSVGRFFFTPDTFWSTDDAGSHWTPYTFR